MDKGSIVEEGLTKSKRKICRCGKNKASIAGLIALGVCFALGAVFLPNLFTMIVKKVSVGDLFLPKVLLPVRRFFLSKSFCMRIRWLS